MSISLKLFLCASGTISHTLHGIKLWNVKMWSHRASASALILALTLENGSGTHFSSIIASVTLSEYYNRESMMSFWASTLTPTLGVTTPLNITTHYNGLPRSILLRNGLALSNGVSLFLFAMATNAPLFTKSYNHVAKMINLSSIQKKSTECLRQHGSIHYIIKGAQWTITEN